MKDSGLCLNCFKPRLPQTGLGITRMFNNFVIRHMQGKKWAAHKCQQRDYVVINLCGKLVKCDQTSQAITLTHDRKDEGVHIALEKYNRAKFCLGKDRCVC